jgi:hypothetical protein
MIRLRRRGGFVAGGFMLAALGVLVALAGPLVFTTGTDTPQKLERVDLPPRCALCPPGRITCAHYATFSVREVDLGDVGAEVLAIAPREPKRPLPACTRERMPGEVSVTGGAENFFGYFEGARGPYVLFRSEERRAGALGFAVYDGATGQRVFTDAAVGPVRLLGGGGHVGLAFQRFSIASCSPLAGGDACWQRIRAELGVGDPPPDCAGAYKEANELAAKEACRDDTQAAARCVEQQLRLRPAFPPVVPPVLGYEVEVADLATPIARAAEGTRVTSCRPSD